MDALFIATIITIIITIIMKAAQAMGSITVPTKHASLSSLSPLLGLSRTLNKNKYREGITPTTTTIPSSLSPLLGAHRCPSHCPTGFLRRRTRSRALFKRRAGIRWRNNIPPAQDKAAYEIVLKALAKAVPKKASQQATISNPKSPPRTHPLMAIVVISACAAAALCPAGFALLLASSLVMAGLLYSARWSWHGNSVLDFADGVLAKDLNTMFACGCAASLLGGLVDSDTTVPLSEFALTAANSLADWLWTLSRVGPSVQEHFTSLVALVLCLLLARHIAHSNSRKGVWLGVLQIFICVGVAYMLDGHDPVASSAACNRHSLSAFVPVGLSSGQCDNNMSYVLTGLAFAALTVCGCVEPHPGMIETAILSTVAAAAVPAAKVAFIAKFSTLTAAFVTQCLAVGGSISTIVALVALHTCFLETQKPSPGGLGMKECLDRERAPVTARAKRKAALGQSTSLCVAVNTTPDTLPTFPGSSFALPANCSFANDSFHGEGCLVNQSSCDNVSCNNITYNLSGNYSGTCKDGEGARGFFGGVADYFREFFSSLDSPLAWMLWLFGDYPIIGHVVRWLIWLVKFFAGYRGWPNYLMPHVIFLRILMAIVQPLQMPDLAAFLELVEEYLVSLSFFSNAVISVTLFLKLTFVIWRINLFSAKHYKGAEPPFWLVTGIFFASSGATFFNMVSGPLATLLLEFIKMCWAILVVIFNFLCAALRPLFDNIIALFSPTVVLAAINANRGILQDVLQIRPTHVAPSDLAKGQLQQRLNDFATFFQATRAQYTHDGVVNETLIKSTAQLAAKHLGLQLRQSVEISEATSTITLQVKALNEHGKIIVDFWDFSLPDLLDPEISHVRARRRGRAVTSETLSDEVLLPRDHLVGVGLAVPSAILGAEPLQSPSTVVTPKQLADYVDGQKKLAKQQALEAEAAKAQKEKKKTPSSGQSSRASSVGSDAMAKGLRKWEAVRGANAASASASAAAPAASSSSTASQGRNSRNNNNNHTAPRSATPVAGLKGNSGGGHTAMGFYSKNHCWAAATMTAVVRILTMFIAEAAHKNRRFERRVDPSSWFALCIDPADSYAYAKRHGADALARHCRSVGERADAREAFQSHLANECIGCLDGTPVTLSDICSLDSTTSSIGLECAAAVLIWRSCYSATDARRDQDENSHWFVALKHDSALWRTLDNRMGQPLSAQQLCSTYPDAGAHRVFYNLSVVCYRGMPAHLGRVVQLALAVCEGCDRAESEFVAKILQLLEDSQKLLDEQSVIRRALAGELAALSPSELAALVARLKHHSESEVATQQLLAAEQAAKQQRLEEEQAATERLLAEELAAEQATQAATKQRQAAEQAAMKQRKAAEQTERQAAEQAATKQRQAAEQAATKQRQAAEQAEQAAMRQRQAAEQLRHKALAACVEEERRARQSLAQGADNAGRRIAAAAADRPKPRPPAAPAKPAAPPAAASPPPPAPVATASPPTVAVPPTPKVLSPLAPPFTPVVSDASTVGTTPVLVVPVAVSAPPVPQPSTTSSPPTVPTTAPVPSSAEPSPPAAADVAVTPASTSTPSSSDTLAQRLAMAQSRTQICYNTVEGGRPNTSMLPPFKKGWDAFSVAARAVFVALTCAHDPGTRIDGHDEQGNPAATYTSPTLRRAARHLTSANFVFYQGTETLAALMTEFFPKSFPEPLLASSDGLIHKVFQLFREQPDRFGALHEDVGLSPYSAEKPWRAWGLHHVASTLCFPPVGQTDAYWALLERRHHQPPRLLVCDTERILTPEEADELERQHAKHIVVTTRRRLFVATDEPELRDAAPSDTDSYGSDDECSDHFEECDSKESDQSDTDSTPGEDSSPAHSDVSCKVRFTKTAPSEIPPNITPEFIKRSAHSPGIIERDYQGKREERSLGGGWEAAIIAVHHAMRSMKFFERPTPDAMKLINANNSDKVAERAKTFSEHTTATFGPTAPIKMKILMTSFPAAFDASDPSETSAEPLILGEFIELYENKDVPPESPIYAYLEPFHEGQTWRCWVRKKGDKWICVYGPKPNQPFDCKNPILYAIADTRPALQRPAPLLGGAAPQPTDFACSSPICRSGVRVAVANTMCAPKCEAAWQRWLDGMFRDWAHGAEQIFSTEFYTPLRNLHAQMIGKPLIAFLQQRQKESNKQANDTKKRAAAQAREAATIYKSEKDGRNAIIEEQRLASIVIQAELHRIFGSRSKPPRPPSPSAAPPAPAAPTSPPPPYEEALRRAAASGNPIPPVTNFASFPPSANVYITPSAAALAYEGAHFRGSQGHAPALAPIPTGRLLLDATFTDEKELEATAPLSNEALVRGVRQQHRRHLREFREWLQLHPTMIPLPLQESAIRYFTDVAPLRKWQWQTMFRSMTSFIGALSNLPLYSNLQHGIRLDRNAPHWTAALKSVNQRAQQSQPRGQTTVSLNSLETALEEEPHLWTRAALILMWMTSSRVGCVLQLEIRDVTIDPITKRLSVLFAHGKGVRLRGPYTRFAQIDGQWEETLLEHIRQRRATTSDETALLFPGTASCPKKRRPAALLASIRVADPKLSLRAMRRGSLQTISAGGAELTDVMEAAGHTNTKTTSRYLGWGTADRASAATGQRITGVLLPSPGLV